MNGSVSYKLTMYCILAISAIAVWISPVISGFGVTAAGLIGGWALLKYKPTVRVDRISLLSPLIVLLVHWIACIVLYDVFPERSGYWGKSGISYTGKLILFALIL